MTETPPPPVSQHETYQRHNLSWNRLIAGLPHGSVTEVIAELIAKKQFANATEMVFGTFYRLEFVELDYFGFQFFMRMWAGLEPAALTQIAEHHQWLNEPPQKGYAIQVYPGEYLIVESAIALGPMMKVITGGIKNLGGKS
jgi:hypothetical protein